MTDLRNVSKSPPVLPKCQSSLKVYFLSLVLPLHAFCSTRAAKRMECFDICSVCERLFLVEVAAYYRRVRDVKKLRVRVAPDRRDLWSVVDSG